MNRAGRSTPHPQADSPHARTGVSPRPPRAWRPAPAGNPLDPRSRSPESTVEDEHSCRPNSPLMVSAEGHESRPEAPMLPWRGHWIRVSRACAQAATGRPTLAPVASPGGCTATSSNQALVASVPPCGVPPNGPGPGSAWLERHDRAASAPGGPASALSTVHLQARLVARNPVRTILRLRRVVRWVTAAQVRPMHPTSSPCFRWTTSTGP